MRGLMVAILLCGLPMAAFGRELQEEGQAKVLAQALLDKGAALFDTRDAKAMAATYVEAGQVMLIKRESETGQIKTEIVNGRAAIEKGYADLFKDRQPDHKARNTVESARFLCPNMLMISGRFSINAAQGDTVQFVQIRTKEGEEWKIVSVQLLELP